MFHWLFNILSVNLWIIRQQFNVSFIIVVKNAIRTTKPVLINRTLQDFKKKRLLKDRPKWIIKIKMAWLIIKMKCYNTPQNGLLHSLFCYFLKLYLYSTILYRKTNILMFVSLKLTKRTRRRRGWNKHPLNENINLLAWVEKKNG